MARRPALNFDLGRFERGVRADVLRAMRATALQGEAIVKVKLSQPGEGRVYPRGRTATHVASLPGQPPAPDTGRLRASVTSRVGETDAGDIVAVLSVNTDYALALELGTDKTAPRPFLRPSLPEIVRVARDAIGRALGRTRSP